MIPHLLVNRISAKGKPFVGTCAACGKTGLTFETMREECENVRGLLQEEAVIEAIKIPTKEQIIMPTTVEDQPAHHRDQVGGSQMNDIGWAVKQMLDGQKVRRTGWNGKGMFIVYMSRLQLPPYNTRETERKVNDRTAKWIGEDAPLDSQPYIAMWTAQRQWQPGWLCSQADLLATDWEIAK